MAGLFRALRMSEMFGDCSTSSQRFRARRKLKLVLVMQIESCLYRRQGKAVTNFQTTLPKPQSDLAQQLIKDPYNFDFLILTSEAQERDLERELLEHLRQFLIELGTGFAFVGSQVPLEVGGEDFKLDLLFYHLKLRCFCVIELKMTPFKPEYAGKMNFYLSAVDDLLRHPDDQPSIGLILCKTKNRIIAEYALRNTATPMGISEFRHLEKLPEQLTGTLPTIEEIEAELGKPEEPSGGSQNHSFGLGPPSHHWSAGLLVGSIASPPGRIFRRFSAPVKIDLLKLILTSATWRVAVRDDTDNPPQGTETVF
jgi:predicted nuclease of restriction endonuclease-like (RecB) superfamily